MKSITSSDAGLIERLKDNEDAAWEEFTELYYDGLILFCGRFVREPSDALDIVHDTFVKAKERIDRFDINQFSSLKPWIWQVARYTAIDAIRSRNLRDKRRERLPVSDSATSQTFLKLPDDNPGPRSQAHKMSKKDALLRCIDELDEKFSEVILLHYIDGFKRREIAETLQISENTVKSRLRLAFEKLRDRLPPDLYSD